MNTEAAPQYLRKDSVAEMMVALLGTGPPSEAKGEFRDLQLEQALDYLRGQVKTAARAEVASGAEKR